MGSLERFFGVLIEHHAGAFPFWLAPVQIKVLTLTDRNIPYAEKVTQELKKTGFRVERDFRSEKINYKIRAAQLEKVPYMIILGDKEEEAQCLSIRKRSGEVMQGVSLADFLQSLKAESQPLSS